VFRDPAFAHDRGRVMEICEGILADSVLSKAAGRSFTWECESRPEHFDVDLLRGMKKAGCGWVKIGLETTCGETLQAVRRLETQEDAEVYRTHVANLVEAAREIGLSCRVFVMGGLPGQNQADFVETARFLRRIHPTAVNVMIYRHYPGIELRAATENEEEIKDQMAPLLAVKADLEREATSDRRRIEVRLRRYWRSMSRWLRRRWE